MNWSCIIPSVNLSGETTENGGERNKKCQSFSLKKSDARAEKGEITSYLGRKIKTFFYLKNTGSN